MESTRRLFALAVCSTLFSLLTSCSTYLNHTVDQPWQPDESLGVNTLYMGFRSDLTFFTHTPKAEDYPTFLALLPYVFIDLPISFVADTLLLPSWTYDELFRHRLHKAAVRGDLEEIQSLLDDGADVDEPGAWGHTPLMMASWAGQSAAVSYLIARGANPNFLVSGAVAMHFNGSQATAYDYAGHQGHCDIAKLLWERMRRSARPLDHSTERCRTAYHARQGSEHH